MKNFKCILRVCITCLLFVNYPDVSFAQASQVWKPLPKLFGRRAAKKAGQDIAEKNIKEISYEMVEKSVNKSQSLLIRQYPSSKTFRPNNRLDVVKHFETKVINNLGNNASFLTSGRKILLNDVNGFPRDAKTFILKTIGDDDSRIVYESLVKDLFTKEITYKAQERTMVATAVEFTGRDALKVLDYHTSYNKTIEILHMNNPDGFSIENLVVNKVGRHHVVKFRNTPSEIIINHAGVIHCMSDIFTGSVNRFLEHLHPETKYIIDNGLIQFRTDNLGRVIEYECFTSEICRLSSKIEDFGNLFNIFPSNLEIPIIKTQSAKLELWALNAIVHGDDVWVRHAIEYTDNGKFVAKRRVKIKDKSTGKEKAKSTSIRANHLGRQSLFHTGKRVLSVADKDALKSGAKELTEKEIREQFPDVAEYLDKFKKRLGDNEYSKSIKVFKNSEEDCLIIEGFDGRLNQESNFIVIKGDDVYARTGNVIGDGHLNEFINNTSMLPNKKIITENSDIITDEFGRVVETIDVYDPAIPSNRSTSRRDFKEVSNSKGGGDNHVGGHLSPHSMGGASEAVNILPMNKDFNGSGPWRYMENQVQSAVDAGKMVRVKKKITYYEGTQIPKEIEVKVEIDGEVTDYFFIHEA